MSLYDGTNAPLIKVYLDTGNRNGGLFTLGYSLIGFSDVLGTYTPFTTLTQFPTTDVKSISIRRGRTREDQAIQPGTLTLTMDNTSGSYDPTFSKASYITAATGSAGVVTYTSANTLNVGDIVSVTGLTAGTLNLKLQTVTSATSTQFTVANSATGTCSGQTGTCYSGYVSESIGWASMLTAGTGVRVTATWAGIEYKLYSGFIEQIDKDLSLEPTVTFTCVDGLAKMARMFTNTDTRTLGDYSAIVQILSSAGWNYGTAGSSNDLYIVSSIPTADALTMIHTIESSQLGMFYVNPSGKATWLNSGVFASGSFAGATPFFTLSDSRTASDVIEYDSISIIGGEKYIKNNVTYTNIDPNGIQNTGTKFNSTSVNRFGTFASQISLYYTQYYAAIIAQLQADHFAFPADRVNSVSFECVGLSSTVWIGILNSDLGSAVIAKRTPIYGNQITYNSYIQEVNHDIKPDSWRMSLTLSPAT
jgi:hypothetical protein